MNSRRSILPVIFAFLMLICVLFIAWYLPAAGQRRFLLEDTRKSLETSQGRERKQQYEYDETVNEMPVIQAELDRMLPLAETAKEEVQSLKAERKKLRQEKKDLEEQASASVSGEEDDHE